MSALKLKQELHDFINSGDEKFIKMFYEMAKAYTTQKHKDTMIAESEEDIETGEILNQKEVKKIIESWKE
jgi:predicted transcriptional regulator